MLDLDSWSSLRWAVCTSVLDVRVHVEVAKALDLYMFCAHRLEEAGVRACTTGAPCLQLEKPPNFDLGT